MEQIKENFSAMRIGDIASLLFVNCENEHNYSYIDDGSVLPQQLSVHYEHAVYKKSDVKVIDETHNIDSIDALKSALFHKLKQDITKNALDIIFNSAELNRKRARGFIEKFIWFFNRKHVKKTKVNAAIDLFYEIGRMRHSITSRTHAAPDYIITGSRVGAILSDSIAFAPMCNKEIHTDIAYLMCIGVYDGMTVYVNPFLEWTDNTMLIGKATKPGQPGLYITIDPSTMKYDTVELDEDSCRIDASMLADISLVGRKSQTDMPECEIVYFNIDKELI